MTEPDNTFIRKFLEDNLYHNVDVTESEEVIVSQQFDRLCKIYGIDMKKLNSWFTGSLWL